MSISRWRKFRTNFPGSVGGKAPPGERPLPYRPQFDTLEGRVLPAPLNMLAAPPVQGGLASGAGIVPPLPQPGNGTPVTPGVLVQSDGKPLPIAPVSLTVPENASNLVVDVRPLFANFKDLHPEDGLRYSVLGNTNSGLVKSALSEAELTLTFAQGKWGSATLTMGAADADGACARVTLVVTVRPLLYTSPPVQPVHMLPSIAGSGTGMPAGPGSASTAALGGGATSGPSVVGSASAFG